jgi:hypothetical protein
MFEESGGEINGRADERDRAPRRGADDTDHDRSDVEAEARLNDMPVACSGKLITAGRQRIGAWKTHQSGDEKRA